MSTAIIAAAGNASRMWPASKVFPKELFPLGRLPVIAHVIWEMLDAGIEDITIVVRNDNSGAIQALLDPQVPPPAGVRDDGVVARFNRMLKTCRFNFVEQNGPYGNGTPLLNGLEFAGDPPYVYAFADDVIFGENVSAGLIRMHQRTGGAVLGAQPVPANDVSKFGILECDLSDQVNYVTRFVEKPRAGETTSNLASLGRYLITGDVVDILRNTPLGRDGELWLSDAFIHMVQRGTAIAAFPLTTGTWHTVGNPEGFTNAVVAAMGAERLAVGPAIQAK